MTIGEAGQKPDRAGAGTRRARLKRRPGRGIGATIRGRVTDRDSGQPLPRFRVSVSRQPVLDENSQTLATALSDSNGRYELPGVPPGAYVLTVQTASVRVHASSAGARPRRTAPRWRARSVSERLS